MMPVPLRAALSGDGPRERSSEAADRTRVCQLIGEGLRRLRVDHQQLIVLLIDLTLPPDGDTDGLVDEVMTRLAAATRPTDTVTRLAPERIVLVAEGVSCGGGCGRRRAPGPLRAGVRPTGVPRGKRYTVGPRVGAAVAVAGAAVTAERLLAQAEAAMPADVASVWARSAAR